MKKLSHSDNPTPERPSAMPRVAPVGEYVITAHYRFLDSVSPLRTRATPAPAEREASTVRLIPKYRYQDLPLVCTIQFPPRGLLKKERQSIPALEYRWLSATGALWTRYRLDQIQSGELLTLPTLPAPTVQLEEIFTTQSEAEAAVTRTVGADTLILLEGDLWQAAVEPLYFVQDDQRLFGDSVQMILVECCTAGCASQYFRLDEQEDAIAMRDGLRRYRRERQRKRYREETEPDHDSLGFAVHLERPDLLRREPRHELPDHFHPWYSHLRQRLRLLPAHTSQADRTAAVLTQARAKDVGPVHPSERRLAYIKPDHAFRTSNEPIYSETERAGLIGFLLAAGSYPVAAYVGLCDAELARAYASAIRFIG